MRFSKFVMCSQNLQNLNVATVKSSFLFIMNYMALSTFKLMKLLPRLFGSLLDKTILSYCEIHQLCIISQQALVVVWIMQDKFLVF